jgi:hypothetical protein
MLQAGRSYRNALAPERLDLPATIKEVQAAGCEPLRAIAAGLEARGISAARGGNGLQSRLPA